MSNKVAVIIPVHPPKKNYLVELLKTYVVNKDYIDIFLVFTTIEDKNFFSDILTPDIHSIVLDNIDLNILQKNLSFINVKKIYALNYVCCNYDYDYSIIIDCDSLFLDMKNVYTICERFCQKKEVYGSIAKNNDLLNINNKSFNFIHSINNIIDINLINKDIYFWFSNNLLEFNTFEYIIYIYYCVLFYDYKIVNLNDLNIYTPMEGWSLEINITHNILNKLHENNIEINWQYYKFKNILDEKMCILYHTDRH